MVVILVALTFLAGMIIVPLVRRALEDRRACDALIERDGKYALTLPFEYKLTPSHIWLYTTASGTVKVGVDELIRCFFGKPDYLQLKKQGEAVRRGDALVVIRKGDSEICLKSPVDGKIVRANAELTMAPERISKDPYRDGWLYVVRPSTSLENIPGLRAAERARSWLSSEMSRLKDFVQGNMQHPSLVAQTLADGGMLADDLISHLDQWSVEEFEREFLNSSTTD